MIENKEQIAIDAMRFFKEKLYNGIYGEFVGNFDTAISALEKQIPKKIKGFVGKCECGKTIYPHMKYCNNCGQALDWSDTE